MNTPKQGDNNSYLFTIIHFELLIDVKNYQHLFLGKLKFLYIPLRIPLILVKFCSFLQNFSDRSPQKCFPHSSIFHQQTLPSHQM